MNKPANHNQTIAAIATPPGRGGVGIIRISGSKAASIAQQITHSSPTPRTAHFVNFHDNDKNILDSGLIIYFPAPNSFTGEEVVELQGHGGPVIMELLLKRVISCGARMARPGEFSERAFLNDKIDLAQAEAIADLINAASEQAAKSATRSLQGEFSKKIRVLVEQLIHLRMYVEAAIDFPEEEIDFLSDGKVANDLNNIQTQLAQVLVTAQQGVILQRGMTVVIAGKPNAGKSSLLNQLSGRDSAIVTEIAGTTRDVLREQIQIDGLPLHIVDTAGLRDSSDIIEQEGIKRAWHEIQQADAILLVLDSASLKASQNEAERSRVNSEEGSFDNLLTLQKPIIAVWNKSDLMPKDFVMPALPNAHNSLFISAKTGAGIGALKQQLKQIIGYQDLGEHAFIARERHLSALMLAQNLLHQGAQQLAENKAGELLAEDLLCAQNALNEITGEFTADDLLGKIFSSFCIGK
jgi:tRNA modification GTPase